MLLLLGFFYKFFLNLVFVKKIILKMNFQSLTIHFSLCLESHVKQVASCFNTNPLGRMIMTTNTFVFKLH